MSAPVENPVSIADLPNQELFLNRELSFLEFHRRVFDEATDESNPLLERVKFLSIVGSNLEEFFMVRVGGLTMQSEASLPTLSIDGQTPKQQLVEIRRSAARLMEDAHKYLVEKLIPDLKAAGIYVLNYDELDPDQKQKADAYFHEVVFPVLTPLAVDPSHPFPYISNLSLNLAVLIRGEGSVPRFARLKVPPLLPQLVPLKSSSGGTRRDGTPPRNHYFVWLHQLIIANLDDLFPGMHAIEAHPFHVTRNADMDIQEWEALDLLDTIEENIKKRRFGVVVRLMINKNMPKSVREILVDNLKVDRNDIYTLDGTLSLRSLMQLTRIDRPDLKDRPFLPVVPPLVRFSPEAPPDAFFAAIRRQPILLHHPYDSFTPVVDFLKSAARDPNVLAIKQTLYRVGTNSPVVQALLEACRDYGKQVAVLVELKARFDEENNIGWARMLEQEGVHVTYGLLGLKTHCKITMVVRKEGDHIRRYLHLASGNYHHITAQIYEDVGMFTCDDAIGEDVTHLFNYLTGYSLKKDYRKLLVAPINLRERLEEMICQEMECHRQNGGGHIIFKMNSLVDPPIIKLLYEASQTGMKIDLIVRGMCSIRPGIKGLSSNIRVISIVGRFLEHSRIYYFHNNGDERLFVGSADLMPRNLNGRVEVLFPVEDPNLVRTLRQDVLDKYMQDNVKARLMQPDGSYKRLKPLDNQPPLNVQDWFINQARLSAS